MAARRTSARVNQTPNQSSEQKMSRDLWSKLTRNGLSENTEASQRREASVAFVGPKQAGKSTIIRNFLNKDNGKPPAPTSSIDYKYARSTVGISAERDVTHYWELGGGKALSKLLEIAVTSQSVENMMVVIVLDLSKPNLLIDDLIWWVKRVRSHINLCINKLEKRDQKARSRIQERAGRIWKGHEDKDRVSVSQVPLVIVANKFDKFRKQDAECLKVMGRALRAVAHSSGASLLYTSHEDKHVSSTIRSMIARHSAQKAVAKTIQAEDTSSLFITAGMDSFKGIGSPPARYETSQARSPVQAWLSAARKLFPASESKEPPEQKLTQPDLEEEPEIDSLLAQKLEEFKQVKREADLQRRLKLQDTQRR